MLGVYLRRGGFGSVMPVNTASVLNENVMEMNSPSHKESSSTVGWGQLPSQNSRPLTLYHAGKQMGSWSMATDMPEGISGPLGFFDPVGLSKPFADPRGAEGRAKFFREAELKHGRVAMLAALGFPVAEKFHPLFGGNIDAPSYLAFQQTPLETFWPFVVLAIGAIEIQSVSIFEEPFGPNGVGGDKWWTLKADRVPGDFALDPLGLYPSDPEEQIEMKTKELNHCRLAMIGIAGMVVQELVSGGERGFLCCGHFGPAAFFVVAAGRARNGCCRASPKPLGCGIPGAVEARIAAGLDLHFRGPLRFFLAGGRVSSPRKETA